MRHMRCRAICRGMKGEDHSMRFMKEKAVLRFFAGVLCVVGLAGCSTADLRSKMEFSVNWVSPEGKSKSQLSEDQKACTHEAMMMSAPPFPGEMGRGGGDMKVFDNCMRSKGWVKE
jgi:hypothetical protein